MTEKPLLSVILPVYNGEKYIDTIIEAFKNQTYKDFELIFIDDGSADGSYEKIHGYIGKTDFPIILRKQENKGVSAARNNGVKAASGKYIAFVDCDDDIVGDYVETLRDAEDSRFRCFCFSKPYDRGKRRRDAEDNEQKHSEIIKIRNVGAFYFRSDGPRRCQSVYRP